MHPCKHPGTHARTAARTCSRTHSAPPSYAHSGMPLLVLGIETSCDDTGAAVVAGDGSVLGEAIATQADIHEQWGERVTGHRDAGRHTRAVG
eukprot:366135-Chlamydomonas_euryale.AAC.8